MAVSPLTSDEFWPAADPSALPLRAPLVDRFGRVHSYLRISVTERCNLRCRYCMPPEGVELRPREAILSYEEIVRVARVFAELGVTKIRLTGGEPLVRRGLPGLVRELKALPGIETLALTTNGLLLAEQAKELAAAGLDKVNVSLDTFRAERFEAITLRPGVERVLAGIDAALATGLAGPGNPLKLNVVVMRGLNEDELVDFVEFARTRPIQIRFIEFMPFAGNEWTMDKLVPYAEMRGLIEKQYKLRRDPRDTDPHNTAREYVIEGFPENAGGVAFITSMTNDFCATCNRVRLTADGNIKSCLFHNGEVNVRGALRGDEDDAVIERFIRQAIAEKPSGHAPLAELGARPNRSMITIGG